MGPDSQSKDPCPAGVLDRGTLVVIMRILSLRGESGRAKRIRSLWSAIFMSVLKIRGYRKRMVSLWLQKGTFWESEERLAGQANTIRRNSWMTEFEKEELERMVTGSDSVLVEEARNVEALPGHVAEDVRNVLPEMGAEEQADSLDEEGVAIGKEIAEVIERGREDKLPALRNVPKKKLLEQTAKIDNVLSKFKTHSITKTNTNIRSED